MQKQYDYARQLAELGELEAAADALQQLLSEDQHLDDMLRGQALELLGRCELGLLRNVQAMVSFSEAERCYERCQWSQGSTYCRLLRVRKLLDDRMLRDARSQLTLALREALARGWTDVLSLGLEYLGLLCFHTKELRKAAGLLKQSLEKGDQRKLSWEWLVLKLSLSNCYRSLGEDAAAAALMCEITDDGRYNSIPRLGAYILMNKAYDAFLAGDTPAARGFFRQVVDAAAAAMHTPKGFSWLGGMASYNLGLLAIEQGDYAEARVILDAMVRLTSNHGYYQLLSGSLTALCIVELILDDPQSALRHAVQCQEYVNQFGDIETRLADYFLALVYLANNQLDNAQLLWLYKPVLESNLEMRMHYGWMLRVLQHLLLKGSGTPFFMEENSQKLAQQWQNEIQQEM